MSRNNNTNDTKYKKRNKFPGKKKTTNDKQYWLATSMMFS